ncbi:serine/threonine-protein kinase ATR-like isoform X1 [Tachypleus tridentatus]|uniref:serine/threonine-protein kinase ATR-like isoform X1 n=1 Tax=Tachypleus tridentatus TaxID=6853 RepID=UPI003FD391B3
MSYLKSRNFSVPKKLIESLSEVLLNHCGKMVNSQCVKTALLYIQREELKQLSAHNPTIQEKPVQHQASTSRLSTKRKRASDDIKGEEPLKFQENTCRNSSWKSPGMNAVDKKICELTEKACEKMKTESTLRYMLPPLATKASPEASMLLKVLAKQMRIQKQELLMNHFKYIFSYLVRHCSKEEMEKALTYVQAKFLQPRLLGFLAFFDSQLLNANFPLEEKKLALGSLNSIMELMGPKHITAVRMKVMATLKIAIHFTEEDFPQICTQAWNTCS